MKVKNLYPPAELPECVVRLALLGWGAPTDMAALSDAEQTQLFDLFLARLAGMVRVWRAHEPFLRGEAARVGIEPVVNAGDSPTARPMFFAERIAAGGHDGE